MGSSNKDSWSLPPSGPGAAPPSHNTDQQGQAPQARALGGFGYVAPPSVILRRTCRESGNAIHQGPSGPGGPVLPPPSTPFYSSGQTSGHNLPTLGELTQSTQTQQHSQAPTAPQQQPPTSSPAQQLGQTQSANYTLPSLGQSVQQQASQGPSSLDRERELREREIREREARDRRQHEEAAQRERELREREHRERQQREHQQPSQPHQNHAGSIPIHQPVASKVTTAIHGPGGLLSNIGSATGVNAPSGPLGGVPNGPANMFGGPLPLGQLVAQTIAGAPIPQQHQVMAFGGAQAPNTHQMPGGVAGLPQGQQPILNDALSYLDQVKVQFVDQPDVYNLFLEIMKDFKSQAIDTPGVIERVSNLFAGHPNLIQGFNTFLPPGYRIECGTGDDPNAIRVTTPMGTTVQSMSSGIRPPSNPPNPAPTSNGVVSTARQGSYYDQISRNSNGNWQQQSQHGASDGLFNHRGPAAAPQIFGHQPAQGQNLDGQNQREQQAASANAAAVAQHQQEQRGVSQLQNAVSVAANGPQVVRQVMMQSTPSVGQSPAMAQQPAAVNGVVPGSGPQQAAQGGMEKRGPVEFNHAISYVNKIKNRFSAQPEIYKQFLEILQTYQRESKPIQDVYAQVTQLFNSAPDLLEDFKQFLPESAAQAKAQAAAKQAAEDAAILSNVRGDLGYLAGAQPSQGAQQSQGGTGIPPRLPPVGNFAPPPSVGKESKKRRTGVQTTVVPSAQSVTSTADIGGSQLSGSRAVSNQGSNIPKRSKLHHNKAPQPDVSAVSPTLTPVLPEPLPPTSNGGPPVEEIAFFDRVKKFIGNKQTMNEFLKLCNLFSQDLIDKNILVNKASSFIGGNVDLYNWFKRWVGYDGRDEVIENKPKASNGKVILSNCRGLGPSYRLLPKRERLKQCSGRDEMCYDVLNDEWASHPTWASEDSGFVAHRKNVYEEALHKIEEERHDYDHNIEANLRTIQLLEPIAQKIAGMSPEERATFTLPPGLHGQSQAIYQRVVKKIYDRERGQRVIDDLHARPCAVVPQLLMRLKQKNEEWRAAQREWEKLWREQTHKAFWKSLDHMGINAKTADKRNFQLKTFTTEIQTKHQEYLRQRQIYASSTPNYQFDYDFKDSSVIIDATRLTLLFVEHTGTYNAGDCQKIEEFLRDFIPAFFGFPRKDLEQGIGAISRRSPDEDNEETPAAWDPPSTRSRRGGNVKKTDLLRGVLERGRNGKPSRKDKEGSAASGSEESMLDVGSAMDEDVNGGAEGSVSPKEDEYASQAWISHPSAVEGRRGDKMIDLPKNQPYVRSQFHLYCNNTIYGFFRLFQILYERLLHCKQHESEVAEDIRRRKMPKPAIDLKMMDKGPDDFFSDNSPTANYYSQVLEMCEQVVEGKLDPSLFEDALRHFYIARGWELYSIDKLLNSIVKQAHQIVLSDTKDKSHDIIVQFLKNREKETTTHSEEITYRRTIEKFVKDDPLYRISFDTDLSSKVATIQILDPNDATYNDVNLDAQTRWSYYVASYHRAEPTEGIVWSRVRNSFLHRLIDQALGEYDRGFDKLEMRIAVGCYKAFFVAGTMDFWCRSAQQQALANVTEADVQRVKEKRNRKFEEKFVMNNLWMKGMSKDEVERKNEEFKRWVGDGILTGAHREQAEEDELMADAS
ncbi:MAG: Transcriptional regulatory protein sin3 [Geoglossum simile]|nr:MAG: Transcriptional regulatory protein sin3 [Geoglossum simile]